MPSDRRGLPINYWKAWGEIEMELASSLEIHEIENNYFLVQHISSQKYVKLGQRETEFLKLIVRTGDLEAAGKEYSGTLTEEERKFMFDKFSEWGFLDQSETSGELTAKPPKKWSFNWRVNDITTIKFLTINPDQWLTSMTPIIRVLLHPIAIAIYLLMIVASGTLLVQDASLQTMPQLTQLGFGSYVLIYLMLLLTTIVHELAHGMVCKHYGGRVSKMGAMLFYFSPAMYCDVSDTYKFKRKRHKLAVLFAGIFSQWLMTSIAILVYYSLLGFHIQVPVLFYYGLANLGISMINMLPLVKLDGYWMLCHGLGIVNLRTKAFQAFFKLLTPWKRHKQDTTGMSGAVQTSMRERSILLIYGFAAVIFTPCFWGWGLYSIQQRLYSFIGVTSFAITVGLAAILLYHAVKFMRAMNKAI